MRGLADSSWSSVRRMAAAMVMRGPSGCGLVVEGGGV
jgi:hypothetical protein